MATGDLWNVDDPLKPWALFGRNSIIDIPFEISDWLASLASTYSTHQIIAPTPLECVTSDHSSGIITIRMKVATGADLILGTKYPFTVSLVCADGQQDERTLRLQLVNL